MDGVQKAAGGSAGWAFPRNSDPHILGIPAGDVLHSLHKDSLPSSLACGLSSPTFINKDEKTLKLVLQDKFKLPFVPFNLSCCFVSCHKTRIEGQATIQ